MELIYLGAGANKNSTISSVDKQGWKWAFCALRHLPQVRKNLAALFHYSVG